MQYLCTYLSFSTNVSLNVFVIIICLHNIYWRYMHIVFEINFNKIQDFNPWPNVNKTWTYRISQKVHGTGHKWNLIWEWVLYMCIGSSLSNVSNLLFDGTNTHMKLLLILWGFYILFYSVWFVFFYAKPFEFWGNIHKSVYCIIPLLTTWCSCQFLFFNIKH